MFTNVPKNPRMLQSHHQRLNYYTKEKVVSRFDVLKKIEQVILNEEEENNAKNAVHHHQDQVQVNPSREHRPDHRY